MEVVYVLLNDMALQIFKLALKSSILLFQLIIVCLHIKKKFVKLFLRIQTPNLPCTQMFPLDQPLFPLFFPSYFLFSMLNGLHLQLFLKLLHLGFSTFLYFPL